MSALYELPNTKSFSAPNKVILGTPTHIIIDANGTIAAIDDCFIGSDAYYYVERNLKQFLIHFWYDKNVANSINRLKLEYYSDKTINTNSKCPKILGDEPTVYLPAVGQSPDQQLQESEDNTATGKGPKEASSKHISTLQSGSDASKGGPGGGPLLKTASSTSAISSSGLISSQTSSSSITARSTAPDDEVRSVLEHVLWRLRENKISAATRTLLEHVLFQAYDRGSLKMLIYEEVPSVLNDWRMVKGIKLISFSRGSSDSQKCYFKSTTRGNISKFFSHYIDGTDKLSPNTEMFKKILEKIKERPDNVLYITSSQLDAETAVKCQMNVILVDREDHSDNVFSQQTARQNAESAPHNVNKLSTKSNERIGKSARPKTREKYRVIKTLNEIVFRKTR